MNTFLIISITTLVACLLATADKGSDQNDVGRVYYLIEDGAFILQPVIDLRLPEGNSGLDQEILELCPGKYGEMHDGEVLYWV